MSVGKNTADFPRMTMRLALQDSCACRRHAAKQHCYADAPSACPCSATGLLSALNHTTGGQYNNSVSNFNVGPQNLVG